MTYRIVQSKEKDHSFKWVKAALPVMDWESKQ